MKGSASAAAAWVSTGWPASRASACCASSRARAPRRSGEKYRCRRLRRGGCANLALFVSNQRLQLVGRRLARRGHVLGQELHLLRHAALDDLVVLVQAHRQRLAVEDLLLDLGLDQPLQFLRRRRSAPLRLEQLGQLVDLVERKPDLLRRRHRRQRARAAPGRTGRTAARRSTGSAAAAHAADVSWCAQNGRRPGDAWAAAPAAPPGLCRR